MINHKEGKELDIHKVRFGWIDFIDDVNVSKALIEKLQNMPNSIT